VIPAADINKLVIFGDAANTGTYLDTITVSIVATGAVEPSNTAIITIDTLDCTVPKAIIEVSNTSTSAIINDTDHINQEVAEGVIHEIPITITNTGTTDLVGTTDSYGNYYTFTSLDGLTINPSINLAPGASADYLIKVDLENLPAGVTSLYGSVIFTTNSDITPTFTIYSDLTITLIKKAPISGDLTLEIDRDISCAQPYILTISDFSIITNGVPSGWVRVKFTVLPNSNSGVFEINGSPVQLNNSILKSQVEAGELIFIPNINTHGVTTTVCTYLLNNKLDGTNWG